MQEQQQLNGIKFIDGLTYRLPFICPNEKPIITCNVQNHTVDSFLHLQNNSLCIPVLLYPSSCSHMVWTGKIPTRHPTVIKSVVHGLLLFAIRMYW